MVSMDNQAQNSLATALLNSDQTVSNLNLKTDYKRQVWTKLEQKISEFIHKPNNRWLIIPGLRGVGKTTLLVQIYKHPDLVKHPNVRRFFLSIDSLLLNGVQIGALVEVLKDLRRHYEQDLFFILLDEVHADPKWSLAAKVIFDQVPKSFLVCTGSSALSLHLNPDSARRAEVIKVHPLNLVESLAIEQSGTDTEHLILPPAKLGRSIADSLFNADNVTQVYSGLTNCQSDVEGYYSQLIKTGGANKSTLEALSGWADKLIEGYISDYGSLPFGAQKNQLVPLGQRLPDDQLASRRQQAWLAINQTITGDVLKLLSNGQPDHRLGFQLQASTVSQLPALIRILANSERISLRKIAQKLEDIHVKTLSMMLRVLTLSELIIEVPPIGSSLGKSTKTPKFLFAAPALRQVLVPTLPAGGAAATKTQRQLRGVLLEDTVIMYLRQVFDPLLSEWVIEYDSSAGGADFLISRQGFKKQGVVIEVGFNKNTAQQAQKTLVQGGKYGLIITNGIKPQISISDNVVFVPLEYFLLVN